RQGCQQAAMAADRILDPERAERHEELCMRVGDGRPAALAVERVDHLRRLPLRARQIERIDLARAVENGGGEIVDGLRWQVLHVLEGEVLAFRAGDLEALR